MFCTKAVNGALLARQSKKRHCHVADMTVGIATALFFPEIVRALKPETQVHGSDVFDCMHLAPIFQCLAIWVGFIAIFFWIWLQSPFCLRFGLEACCQVAAVLNPTLTSGSVEGIIKDWLGMEADMQHKFVAHGGCGVVVIMFV